MIEMEQDVLWGRGEMKTYPEPLDDWDGARCAVWLGGWGGGGRWDMKTYPEPFNDVEGKQYVLEGGGMKISYPEPLHDWNGAGTQ